MRQFNAGREADCPYADVGIGGVVDAETRGGVPSVVVLERTYCGEHPGSKCSLCEEEIGEEHSVIYAGELGGEVLVLDVLADVDRIEIHEQAADTVGRYDEGRAGEVFVYAGDTEVEIPEIGVAARTPGRRPLGERDVRPFRTGLHRPHFGSLTAARAAVQNFVRELGRPIEVVEVPLDGEEQPSGLGQGRAAAPLGLAVAALLGEPRVQAALPALLEALQHELAGIRLDADGQLRLRHPLEARLRGRAEPLGQAGVAGEHREGDQPRPSSRTSGAVRIRSSPSSASTTTGTTSLAT